MNTSCASYDIQDVPKATFDIGRGDGVGMALQPLAAALRLREEEKQHHISKLRYGRRLSLSRDKEHLAREALCIIVRNGNCDGTWVLLAFYGVPLLYSIKPSGLLFQHYY